MNGPTRVVALTVLVLVAGMAVDASAAARGGERVRQWAEAVAWQAAEAQRRQREARPRLEYERRRSAAHARMPDTMYASTPSALAKAEFSCPALVDEDTRYIYRRFLEERRGYLTMPGPAAITSGKGAQDTGIKVFSAHRQDLIEGPSSWLKSQDKDDPLNHLLQASAWAPTAYESKSASESTHHVYLVPSASEPLREGFVRVINHSDEAGEVMIDPIDDSGRQFDTITLSIEANETVHFNSGDLETGNEGKGLSGSTGSGEGDWRLAFSSDLDIEVLSYIRTGDGFLTAMHDVAPVEGNVHRVAIFNPGSNKNQVSRLRLINPTDTTANITIRGKDDKGMPGSGEVSLSLDAGISKEISAEQLEEGGTGLAGMLGDGSGKWRLEIESEQAVVAMSLLESPTDHLTNLSTVPRELEDGVHSVPLFPAAGDDSGRQGFVRVVNGSATDGEVSIKAYDETERDYEALTLTISANEVVHFNSDDLEQGSPQKGLSGGTGAGEGDWRLELTSDLEVEVLSYIRTTDGFLTAMHDVAPSAETRHRVAVFNPGSNRNQESLLRLINPGDETAAVTITGLDDKGAAGTSAVSLSVPGGSSRTVGAWDLESGAEGLNGALGEGVGKWQLMIESNRPVVAMSLLRSPTGHLTNLSTAPVRGAKGGSIEEPQTAEAVFRQLISGPIVQSKCITCHVEGGASGNTRLVFVTDENPDHEAINLRVFEDFLDEEEDGASYILNKIQGALGHGGGIQVAAGTNEYSHMERFLGLLREDVGPVSISPDTLFDGVTMESARSTLRRAAIVFAGRIPTAEEYASIDLGGMDGLRTAIRGVLNGPGFHEFLIRGANDRLLTDRRMSDVFEGNGRGFFVEFSNKLYELHVEGEESDDLAAVEFWNGAVHYGGGRAPLELIKHVVENDLSYAEILTADYIMANPQTAEAYGAKTAFDDPSDPHEFRPSEIVTYYRMGEGREEECLPNGVCRIVDPGPLATNYPHAGILNTTSFLHRYPTTATNRNRARSRWTYYHFLGLDVEKSASRTTDPVALADTNNPTMHNPACTVCHRVLDPVAAAFQNYGDEGYYRDQWGGLDSLDGDYKEGTDSLVKVEVAGDVYKQRKTFEEPVWLQPGSSLVIRHYQNNGCGEDGEQTCGRDLRIEDFHIRDDADRVVDRIEWSELDEHCEYDGQYEAGSSGEDDHYRWWGWECHEIPVQLEASGQYTLSITAWADQSGSEVTSFKFGVNLYQTGDTWYRNMRPPGFDGEDVADTASSLQWLARKIVADQRFAESTVKFWWPAIMGSEVAEPPGDSGDADFEGQLLAASAQAAEVERLAGGFRRGFGRGSPYNLKDLLVEIALTPWFRAESVADSSPNVRTALARAGARRLLTPEELARKTLATTGFQWGRPRDPVGGQFHLSNAGNLADPESYGLLYGGIDSDGVTERARDLTSIMAGVAQSHALETSCPVVMREFYLLPEEERLLFAGIGSEVTPAREFGGTFVVEAASRAEMETVEVSGHLRSGEVMVKLAYLNDYWGGPTADRDLLLDRVAVWRGSEVVYELEMEDHEHPVDCHHIEQGAFHLSSSGAECVLTVPVDIPSDGSYRVEVGVWGDQAGDESPILDILVESDTERSAGARAIRSKLVELYERLHGIRVAPESFEVSDAYELFVQVWDRKRSTGVDFDEWNENVGCDWTSDRFFLDGIVDGAWVYREDWGDGWGARHDWDWDTIDAHFNAIDWSDSHGVARTWKVVLAYLLMDYRYLYL